MATRIQLSRLTVACPNCQDPLVVYRSEDSAGSWSKWWIECQQLRVIPKCRVFRCYAIDLLDLFTAAACSGTSVIFLGGLSFLRYRLRMPKWMFAPSEYEPFPACDIPFSLQPPSDQ